MTKSFRTVATIALATAGLALLSGATRPRASAVKPSAAPAAASAGAAQNWNAVITRTDHDSYVLGNPKAKVKLTAFISYTCPHCAAFEAESEGPLRLSFIAGGQGSLEVRNFVRDGVDLTVAMLTHCGPPSKFFLNHSAFLGSQSSWIEPALAPSPMQKQRWYSGALAQRLRYIATDFHFYQIMETRGYSRPEVDKCLADTALAKRLAEGTDKAQKDYAIQGTPSFLIDNVLLSGTYSWDVLRPQIEARVD
jgi:protein-disulfide isomerase